MKTEFQIEIDQVSIKLFFPEARIKTKLKIIEILLEACRYILYSEKDKPIESANKIIVQIDKMNRLFFIGDSKIYSIAFPFNLYSDTDYTKIRYKNLIDIDSFTISNLLSFVKNPIIDSDNYLDFLEPMMDFEQEFQLSYWPVLKDLLLSEDGYIRYDKDEKGYLEARKNNQEHRHPLHHLDIFYSNSVTFKLGLKKELGDMEFVDTLDRNTDCKYLK